MSLFYSQNCEDVLLARCFEGQNEGFYVDVGAEHPIEGSVTKHFYDRGWNGINIEPVPKFFELIKQDRPRDINIQCVASDRDHQLLRLHVAEGTGLSSVNPQYQQNLESQLNTKIQNLEVRSQRLSTILSKHAKQRIDFLKIDVEGHELSVLHGLDLALHRPRVILIETTLPLIHPGGRIDMHERPVEAPDSERINSLVSGAGYSKVHFDGLNTWWIDQAEIGLARAFTTPPNCFDTVSPMEKYRIIRQLNEDVQKTTETNQILEQNMHQLQDSLDTLQQQQTDLLNSTSWKLTAPLRALCRLTKKYSLR